MRLERIAFADVPWAELDAYADRTIFQTREWMSFVAEAQDAEPVCAKIERDGETVGYFSGLLVRRLGLKILGSPFPGWTTSFMGLNMNPGTPRRDALPALAEFAFRGLGCIHVEIYDPGLTAQDATDAHYGCKSTFTYQSDLTRSEDQMFSGMGKECRNKIRNAEKRGVTIEEASDLAFADDYYAQLIEVFAKQKLTPTYGPDRVKALIRNLLPTGHLLLLRARDPAGTCIATGIYAGVNKLAEFWGNASAKAYLHLRPNEALHWYAMRYWKSKGLETLNWGRGEYKVKYGVVRVPVAWLSRSRFSFISSLRNGAERAFYWRRKFLARSKRDAPADVNAP